MSNCEPAASPPAADGSVLFRNLEDRLLKAESVRLAYRATADGAISARLAGQVALATGNRARVELNGDIRKPVSITFASDGRTMTRSGSSALERAAAPDLRGSIVVGLMRRGLLHNLAALAGGQFPDRADGTVQDSAQVSNVTAGPVEMVGGVDVRPLLFQIEFGGKTTARATLWLRDDTGLPLRRAQTVQFPDGEMRVTEEYERFEIGQQLEGRLFERGH